MSAVLANASANFEFNGAHITLACSSPDELLAALGKFGKGPAANDTPAPTTGKSSGRAATAPAGPNASQTAASSAPAAAAQAAGSAGNGASTSAPATAQPAASGSAAGEAGNATGGQAAAASTALLEKPEDAAAPVTFGVLKKAFLALSTKADGRAKCEAVVAKFNLKKLSDALPTEHQGKPADQCADVVSDAFGPILAAIEEASK